MFRAYIKRYDKGLQVLDSRESVIVGSDYSTFANSLTTMVLDPPQTISSSNDNWVGRYIIFQIPDGSTYDSFANSLIGAQVQSQQLNGSGQIAQVTFDREVIAIPQPSDSFWQILPNGDPSISGQNNIMLDREIDSVSFSSEIDAGFGSCTVSLNEHANVLGRYFSYMPGMFLEIQDVSGYRCWEGLIVSVSINGFGGSIVGIGPRATFNWMDATDYVVGSDAISIDILKDVIQANPYVSSDSDNGLDRSQYVNGVLKAQPMRTGQIALGSNAVGPRDYSKGQSTAEEIIQDMLDLGTYGNGPNKLTLQVWHDLLPVTCIIKRDPTYADVQWVIPSSAFENRFRGMTIETDIANTEGFVFSTYQDVNGNDRISPVNANVNIIDQFGHRMKSITTKDNGSGSAYNTSRVAARDKSMLGGPGSIKLRGYVKPRFGNACIPVYHIKAGDVVAIEDSVGYSSLYRNRFITPGIFTVGSTTFNSSDMSVTITMAESPPIREFFINRIDDI